MRRKRLLLDARKFRADPSLAPEQKPFGSKVLVNACTPWKQLGKPPVRTLLRRSTVASVAQRWSELGFKGPPPEIATVLNDA